MNNKILITGADGFIGSHLTEMLLGLGYNVRALIYYNSFNNWGWLEGIKEIKNLEIFTGDIRDPYFCLEILKDVSVVFNLAALVAIPFSYISPGNYFKTNIEGTYNICEAARNIKNIRVIHISSSEVYGTAQYVPIDEKHQRHSQSPYAASKNGADAVAQSYYCSYNLPVTIARPFNTYGPRQSCRAVIPAIITQILSGVKKVKLGNTSPTRDFNFVQDICEGLISLLHYENTIGKEINICSNTEFSISQVFDIIAGILQKNVQPEFDEKLSRPDKSEVYRLKGDNSLIKRLTGWEPKVSLNTGLKLACEWYSKGENLKKFKTGIINL